MKLPNFFNHPAPLDHNQVVLPQTSTLPTINIIPQLGNIFALLKEGVVLLNASKQIVLTNKNAELMLNYTLPEMINRSIDSLVGISTEAGQKILTSNFYTGGYFSLTEPVYLTGKNHSQVKVQIQAIPFSDGGLLNHSCLLVLNDISKQKELEEMQIDFVSMASHELRTPLTSIINYLDVLHQELTNLDPEHKQMLERVFSSSKLLLSLVNNMLDVSRIERGAATVALAPLDWAKDLSQIIEDNKPLAIQRNISLELEPLPAGLPFVLADPIRINEVLNNLISNALKHTASGGQVKIKTEVSGQDVITSIIDNGEGMSKEIIAHLFTKFYRVPGSLDKVNQGTGLGLFISKAIIDLHKGKIWVDSEPNKGSAFHFSLPIAQHASSIVNLSNLKKP